LAPSDSFVHMDDFPGIMRIQGFRDLQPEPPTTVYHYTTSSGLIGILGEAAMWATHGRFLNDQSELKYGREQLFLAMSRSEKTFGSTHPVQFKALRKVVLEDETISNAEPVFVASFTARSDHVSQWERYSGRHGYAIGFDSSSMSDLAKDQGWIFLKMLYSRKQQQQALAAILAEIFSRVNSDFPIDSGLSVDEKREPSQQSLSKWAFDRAMSLWLASLCFKDKSFAEEREWRLLIFAEDDELENIRFRSGRLGIIPYLTFTVQGAGGTWLIKELTVGTTNYVEDSEFAARLALREVDPLGDKVRIRHSTVPLRV
jgi:hypothetical protein